MYEGKQLTPVSGQQKISGRDHVSFFGKQKISCFFFSIGKTAFDGSPMNL